MLMFTHKELGKGGEILGMRQSLVLQSSCFSCESLAPERGVTGLLQD